MITDADIAKLKKVFATKDDLKTLSSKFETKFAFKVELKTEINLLDKKMDTITIELVRFIGEVKDEIMKELNDFRSEVHDFRVEMRNINSNNQSTLNNHEVRISHLEYNKA